MSQGFLRELPCGEFHYDDGVEPVPVDDPGVDVAYVDLGCDPGTQLL